MSIEAMKQALEALEMYINMDTHDEAHILEVDIAPKAITALRTAIEQAEKQEPFGYFQYSMHMDAWVQNRDSNKGVAFYTTPPAAPVQEPHSWYSAEHDEWMTNKTRKEHERLNSYTHKVGGFDLPLYTTPPAAQRQWVGLTDEEVDELDCVKAMWPDYDQVEIHGVKEFYRAIEAKLREKNGGQA